MKEDALRGILETINARNASVFAHEWVSPINEALDRYGITSWLRVVHFMAQVLHESGGLRYREEIWVPTASQLRYEGRVDLGNTLPGDGYRYRGRGLIQLTGRANYTAYARASGIDVVSDPDLLTLTTLAVDSAAWFWSWRGLNELADTDDLETITRRVNGGLNGFEQRKHYLEVMKAALPLEFGEELPTFSTLVLHFPKLEPIVVRHSFVTRARDEKLDIRFLEE